MPRLLHHISARYHHRIKTCTSATKIDIFRHVWRLMYTNAKSPPPKSALHMSGLSMLTLDRHRRNGYSIESFVVNQRGSPVGIKKKIKKELIGTSDYPSNKIFTISNFITFTRLILTLVFLYLFVTDNNRVIAIVIYAVAASTDWMDGQIARMTKTVSWLGKVMDPICDRALLFTGVLGLVVRGELPIWVCVLIIGRDIYLGIGTLIVRHYHRRPIDVVFPGKIATALLMTGFSLMLLGFPVIDGLHLLPSALTAFPGFNGSSVPLGIFFVYGGVIFSMLTAVIYSIKGGAAIKQALMHPEDEDTDFLNPEIED